MDKKLSFKQIMIIVAFAIVLYVGLMNLGAVVYAVKKFIAMLSPLVYGGLLAVIINVIMCGIEKGIRKLFKKKTPKEAVVMTISLVLSIIVILAFVAVVIWLIVPQFVSAFPKIKSSIVANWDNISSFASRVGIELGSLQSILDKFDTNFWTQKVMPSLGQLFSTAVGAVSAITGGVFMAVISFVACLYILVSKKKLSKQIVNLLNAYCKKSVSEKIIYFFGTLNETFKRFFSVQFLEALILGTMLLIVMLLLRLPYAGVIAALTAIFALIPYFGAFISCFIGALLILLIDVKSALIFVVVFLVVQQIEGNVIYPRIVGKSVGLSPLWTLIAVYAGGELFGIIGMFLFIPLVSVIYTIVSSDIKKRNEIKKQIIDQ